jgi:hypothetical protein
MRRIGLGIAYLALAAAGTSARPALAQTAPAATVATAQPAAPPAAKPTDAASTDAQPPANPKYQLGVRIGFSTPFGDLANSVAGAMPLWIDGGYHITPQIVIGVYARIAVGFTTSSCMASCNGYFLGFGGEAHYHFAPIKGLDPWVGVGGGYETASMDGGSFSGFEFGNVQAGLDYKPGFGPFLGGSIDQYSVGGSNTTAEWVTFGVRGTYDW